MFSKSEKNETDFEGNRKDSYTLGNKGQFSQFLLPRKTHLHICKIGLCSVNNSRTFKMCNWEKDRSQRIAFCRYSIVRWTWICRRQLSLMSVKRSLHYLFILNMQAWINNQIFRLIALSFEIGLVHPTSLHSFHFRHPGQWTRTSFVEETVSLQLWQEWKTCCERLRYGDCCIWVNT